jgi:hypothetical protein
MEAPKELTNKTSELENIAASVVVSNDAEMAWAAGFLTTLKALADDIKDTFAIPKETAHKAHKAILAAEKKHLEPVARIDLNVRAKISAYMIARQAIERKKQDDAKLALAQTLEVAGQNEMAMAVMDTTTNVEKPKMEGVSTRAVFTYRVVNYKLVPDEYWMLNEALVGKEVRLKGKDANIPGIEVDESVGLTVRGSV